MDSTNTLPQVVEGTNAVLAINENFDAASPSMFYGRDAAGCEGLVWAYIGAARWGGFLIPNDDVTLDASDTTYMVVDKADGIVSFDTSTYDWNDDTNFCRAYKIFTGTTAVTGWEDHRAGPGGTMFGTGGGGGGTVDTIDDGPGIAVDSTDPANPIVSIDADLICLAMACSDETTALTTGTAKARMINPYSTAFIVSKVLASLSAAQASGSIFTVDINEAGSSILSTKLTIDNTEKNSSTAATAAVVSDASIAAYAEISFDIDQVGDGTATGLKVYILGRPS